MRVHVRRVKRCSSAKQLPRYNVTEHNEGIKGLRELVMDALHSQDDYKGLQQRLALWDGCDQIRDRASVV